MYLRGPVFAPLYTSVVDITTASTIDGLRSIDRRSRPGARRSVRRGGSLDGERLAVPD